MQLQKELEFCLVKYKLPQQIISLEVWPANIFIVKYVSITIAENVRRAWNFAQHVYGKKQGQSQVGSTMGAAQDTKIYNGRFLQWPMVKKIFLQNTVMLYAVRWHIICWFNFTKKSSEIISLKMIRK